MKRLTVYMYKEGDRLQFRPHQKTLYDIWVKRIETDQTIKVTMGLNKRQKTNEQLGYWYSAILPNAVQGLLDAGHDTLFDSTVGDFTVGVATTMDTADLLLKTLYKSHMMLDELPLKRKMSVEEMSKLIDFTIKWLAEKLGVICPNPEEY